MNPSKPDDWDDIDEASLESFPASDPPARGSFHAAASESTAVPSDDELLFCAEIETVDEPVEHLIHSAEKIPNPTLRNFVMGAATAAGLFLIASRLRRRWA